MKNKKIKNILRPKNKTLLRVLLAARLVVLVRKVLTQNPPTVNSTNNSTVEKTVPIVWHSSLFAHCYESYASMAARGIFTYERADFSDGDGLIYKQVYIPDNCIFLKNQPREIQILLGGAIPFDPNCNEILDIGKVGLNLK